MDDFRGLFTVRDAEPTDTSFIMATFLRGLYHGDSEEGPHVILKFISIMPRKVFMDNYKHVAMKLISSPNTVIKVACLIEDPDVILGYSILSSDFQTIHWVYVKSIWRLKGIGKSLIPAYATTASHISHLGRKLMIKYKDMIFNPFKL